jgi:hypothetical protein
MSVKKVEYDGLVLNLRHRFPDAEACLEFLANLKWRDGFVCKKCGHTNYCKGKTPYSRLCTRCKKEESATAHTVFHRCKIPMTQAFEMAFLVCNLPDVSSYQISKQMNIRQMTCYSFQKKVKQCLSGKSKEPVLHELMRLG